VCAEAGLDGVLEDVLHRRPEVALVTEDERGEALFEEVASPPVAFDEAPGLVTVEPPHALRELLPRGLEHEVVVGSQQAVRVAAPVEELDGRAQELEEVEPVEVVDEEREAEDGPSRGMEEPVLELAARESWRCAMTVAPSCRFRRNPAPIRSGFGTTQ
jgi:hypothetical protein